MGGGGGLPGLFISGAIAFQCGGSEILLSRWKRARENIRK